MSKPHPNDPSTCIHLGRRMPVLSRDVACALVAWQRTDEAGAIAVAHGLRLWIDSPGSVLLAVARVLVCSEIWVMNVSGAGIDCTYLLLRWNGSFFNELGFVAASEKEAVEDMEVQCPGAAIVFERMSMEWTMDTMMETGCHTVAGAWYLGRYLPLYYPRLAAHVMQIGDPIHHLPDIDAN